MFVGWGTTQNLIEIVVHCDRKYWNHLREYTQMSEHKCQQSLNCKNADINFGRLIRSIFFSGSSCTTHYRRRETYFYNINTDIWTRGPDMSRARRDHTCNLVTHIDGTRDIVIVGGAGDSSCSWGNTNVDIIHLDSNSQAHRSGKNDSLHCKSLWIVLYWSFITT